MKNKGLMVVAVLCLFRGVYCHDLPKNIDQRLNSFLSEWVDEADRQEFSKYFSGKLEEMKQSKLEHGELSKKLENKQQKTMVVGASSVQVKHPEIAKSMKQYFDPKRIKYNTDPTQKVVNTFLFRYGSYEEFKTGNTKQLTKMASKVRSYVSGVSTRVANWFGSFRKNKTKTV